MSNQVWLIERIRQGDQEAWREIIETHEGRLTAFVRSRLHESFAVEDVVQEIFLGFLRSLPHFDPTRNLESYLFTIAAHKIRDYLRNQGRHPMGLLNDMEGVTSAWEPTDRMRHPSSLLASAERIHGEEERLVAALGALVNDWRRAGDFRRLKCIELLFVAGWPNREVARYVGLTEQQVANYKFQVVELLGRRSRLSDNNDS